MNPIDEAIRESLLENWIYAAATLERFLNAHDSFYRLDPKYEQVWRIFHSATGSLGRPYISLTRDPMYLLESHSEQHSWNPWRYFKSIENQEIQLKMTE